MPTSRPSATPALFAFVLVAALGMAAPAAGPQGLTTDALFETSKIWDVHLTFSADAWSALTPPQPPPPPPPPPRPAGAPPQPPAANATPPSIPPDVLARLLKGFVAPEGRRNGISGAMRDLDFPFVHAGIDVEGHSFADVAVRLKGNGTYLPQFGKPSLKIDLNKFVKGQKLAGISTLNLHNNITDASWMNEALAYRFYRDAGVPAPRTAYARVYVTVAGGAARKYLGLYGLVENVDTNFAASRYSVPDGAIFKPVTTVPFKDVGKDWAAYNQMYDPKTDLTAGDKQRIMDFCDLVSNATDSVFATRIGEFLDMGAFAKYTAALVWMANPDSILQQGQNYYLYLHPKTRLISFLPWDQDHSFGQFVPFTPAERQQQMDLMRPWTRAFGGVPALEPYAEQLRNRFFERMFAHEPFTRRYLAEVAVLNRGVANPDRLAKQFDELGALLGPVAADEPWGTRTPSFKESLGEAPFKRPSNPNVTVVPAKTFVRLRHQSVQAQLKSLGIP